MWYSGQWFGPEVVARIAEAVEAVPSISRRALSRKLCEWLDWRSPSGKLREVGGRKALAELEKRGDITLPAPVQVREFERERGTGHQPVAVSEMRCNLDELGVVDVVEVTSRYAKASAVWNSLMDAHHYLGSGPLCGAQIRYLIRSSTYGWLGGLSFSAATHHLKARDDRIGWSERARLVNLERVVCNSRFLIAPSVEVPNLASHVLGLAVRRLGRDWQERYGYAPVLVETFVDGQRFRGTCYQAANWHHIGQTAGRSAAFANGAHSTGKKEIYLYPLCADWQTILCHEPEDPLVLRAPQTGSDWAEQEFAGARLVDQRLRDRVYTLARDFFARPCALIPEACGGSMAKTKAAYRFLDNERVDLKSLLRGHVEATAHRVSQHAVVLAVQDTTTLNYTAHPTTEGPGPINTTKDAAVGLVVHDTMAFSTEGTPLGLLDVQCWARDPEQEGKSAKRKTLPIEEKESFKWLKSYQAVAEVKKLCPQTLLVSVGDREADIHDLFYCALQDASGPAVLVRSERSRNRQVATDEDETCEALWTSVLSTPVRGHQQIRIPRQGSRAARIATLEVRYAQVTLKAPKISTLSPVSVWAVHAREVDAPADGSPPVEWMLLTTVAVSTFDDATERLHWYALRWGIEVFHRVLKSGCRIEDRQLCDANRLESCIAIDMVVGWRVFWLTKMGRETPDIPCDVFLEEEEWKVLHMAVHDEPPPATPPSLRDAVRMIARLGGFLGRKGDGEPGTTTVWRGLIYLDGMVIGYRLARRHNGPGPEQ
jgi:hypothetical protein